MTEHAVEVNGEVVAVVISEGFGNIERAIAEDQKKMTYAYIVRRGDSYAIQKTAIADAHGNEREVDWQEGLTREEALAKVGNAELVRCDT